MRTEKSLYIRILLWVYERQDVGFSWEDLEKEFGLNATQMPWVQKVFYSNSPPSENLIDHLNYSDENMHRFLITAKGTSAAVEYLNLKEAKEGSRRAEKIALVAIVIGVVVGMLQIIIGLAQLYNFNLSILNF